MSKELEAFSRFLKNRYMGDYKDCRYDICIIEKALKALEIIKCDGLDLINLIKSKTVEEYNRIRYKKYNELTPAGYDLLKEVML